MRDLIVVHSADGWSIERIAAALACSASTVSRTRRRWHEGGEAALIDRREDNGDAKVDEDYIATVRWMLQYPASEFLHRRPTWTRQLLIETAQPYTGTTVSVTTLGRVWATRGARRGRAKPIAPCPWSKRRKTKRLLLIRSLVDTLSADQACVWEDEVDIDLNPRIGCDWTLPGQQRRIPTPGKHVKRSLAGAMDAAASRLVWVRGDRKHSGLFIELLKRLPGVYADKQVIHVILDNDSIHNSRQTQAWLAEHGQKIRLHFLPPYCPDDNRIERCVWRELHQNVTVNHRHTTSESLMEAVSRWLSKKNRSLSQLRQAI